VRATPTSFESSVAWCARGVLEFRLPTCILATMRPLSVYIAAVSVSPVRLAAGGGEAGPTCRTIFGSLVVYMSLPLLCVCGA